MERALVGRGAVRDETRRAFERLAKGEEEVAHIAAVGLGRRRGGVEEEDAGGGGAALVTEEMGVGHGRPLPLDEDGVAEVPERGDAVRGAFGGIERIAGRRRLLA